MDRNRISVRLSDTQIQRLQRSCGETGLNITGIVHQALDAFLTPETGLAPTTGRATLLHPPEQILKPVCKYFGWGDGDPRVELKRQFTEILACSYALTKTFPRIAYIKMLYEALRRLCEHFGMD